MNVHRPGRWPQVATQAALLTVAAALGVALSASPDEAAALGLPTITLPGLTTITLPGLSTTTATTTGSEPAPPAEPPAQTAPPSQTAPSATPAAAAAAPAADTVVAGAIRLAGGAVSIPVSSVRVPARLRILLSFAPKKLTRGTQPVSVRARIVDTRGYVVRGARVVVRAGRSGTLRGAGKRMSKIDGLADFVVRNRVALTRGARLVLLVQAVDPAAPKEAAASLRVQVAVGRP